MVLGSVLRDSLADCQALVAIWFGKVIFSPQFQALQKTEALSRHLQLPSLRVCKAALVSGLYSYQFVSHQYHFMELMADEHKYP